MPNVGTRTLVAPITPDVRAVSDLRQRQWQLVQLNNDFIRVADQRSCDAGATFILANAPNSGTACELVNLGSVGRTQVASIVTRGQWLGVFSATGLSQPCSQGAIHAVGVALSPAATGSGEYVACWVKR